MYDLLSCVYGILVVCFHYVFFMCVSSQEEEEEGGRRGCGNGGSGGQHVAKEVHRAKGGGTSG